MQSNLSSFLSVIMLWVAVTYTFTFDPAGPLLGMYSEDMPKIVRIYICERLFMATFLPIAKYWTLSQSSYVAEGLCKLWYSTQVEDYVAVKEEGSSLWDNTEWFPGWIVKGKMISEKEHMY